jgi:hypothetical protein
METMLVEFRFDSEVEISNCQHFDFTLDKECRALA